MFSHIRGKFNNYAVFSVNFNVYIYLFGNIILYFITTQDFRLPNYAVWIYPRSNDQLLQHIASSYVIIRIFLFIPLYNIIFYDFIFRRTYLTLSLFMWALNLSKISNRLGLLGPKSYYLRHTFKMVGREKP